MGYVVPTVTEGQMIVHGKLTRREREVIALIADHKSTLEIADALGIKARTVELYRLSIRRKLGLARTPRLVEAIEGRTE